MKNKLKLIQILLIVQFVFWLAFAMARFFWIYNLPIIVLMSVNALLFLLFAYLLKFKQVWIFYLTVVFVFVNAFLSIADQAGIYDWISFILSAIILVLLLVNKGELLNEQKANSR